MGPWPALTQPEPRPLHPVYSPVQAGGPRRQGEKLKSMFFTCKIIDFDFPEKRKWCSYHVKSLISISLKNESGVPTT